jgi:NitT/TauT family transport system substrate-binding protein
MAKLDGGDDENGMTMRDGLSRRSFLAGTAAAAAAIHVPAQVRAAAPLRVGYSAWPGWFPMKVAEQEGLFKRNGVDVEMVWFDDYTASIDALTAGKIDGNGETTNDAISSQAGGAKRMIVLTTDNSSGNDQIIAKKSIPSVKALAGKSVAVEYGLVDHFLLLLALQKAGVPQSAVTIKRLPTDQAAAAFASGKVDACAVWAPFTTTAMKTGIGHVLESSRDFPGAIPDHFVFAPAVVKNRPADVQGFVNTWFDTLAYIKANPRQSLEIMAKRAGVSVSDYVSYDKGTRIFGLAQNLEAFTPGHDMTHLNYSGKMMAQFLVQTGLAKHLVDVDSMLDPSFVKAYAARHA